MSRKIVLGLPDIHPVPRELHLVQSLLRGHLRENFSFNRAGPQRNPLNHISVEEVEPRIDLVADESGRFFNKSFDLSILFSDDHSILGRVFHLSYHDCALFSVVEMKRDQLVKRVLANHIRVEHEEKTLHVLLPNYFFG